LVTSFSWDLAHEINQAILKDGVTHGVNVDDKLEKSCKKVKKDKKSRIQWREPSLTGEPEARIQN
jgi:hypothetical protein